MSRADTLRALDKKLVSFLEEAVKLKDARLDILGSLNRLDDITRLSVGGDDVTDRIGQWFAINNDKLETGNFRKTDFNRINLMLGQIQREIHATGTESPASRKISSEISRWSSESGGTPNTSTKRPKLILKRGPETTEPDLTDETIPLFSNTLDDIKDLFDDLSGNRRHLLSMLDEALKTAENGQSKEALLLSALTIYYLKQNGYKVEPFVDRLKKAESLQKGTDKHA